jgi:cytochrome c-type biogenesis protein
MVFELIDGLKFIIPLYCFLLGVISILEPCILPTLPLIISFFLKEKRKTRILAFVFGFLLLFVLMIILTSIFIAYANIYLSHIRKIFSVVLIIIGLSILIDKKIFSFNVSYGNKILNNDSLTNYFSLGFLTSLSMGACFSTTFALLYSFLVASITNINYLIINLIIYLIGFGLSIFIFGYLVSSIKIEKILKKADIINKISGILFVLLGVYYLLSNFDLI